MRGRTVSVSFGENRAVIVSPIFQYDYGQRLVFEDITLPDSYEVQFGNSLSGSAVTMVGDSDGVDIPDSVLTNGCPVYAWVYLHESESDGETEYVVTIPVTKRASISNAEPTPVQQDTITELIARLNAGVTAVETAVDSIDELVSDAIEDLVATTAETQTYLGIT